MSDRDINKIAEAFAESPGAESGREQPVPSAADKRPSEGKRPLVDVNYPDPTSLSVILRDVAKWSGYAFVMEPSANVRLQIFAPEPLVPQHAYELFLASLSVVGLRAVQVGHVVKIVPVVYVISA